MKNKKDGMIESLKQSMNNKRLLTEGEKLQKNTNIFEEEVENQKIKPKIAHFRSQSVIKS